MSDAPHNYREPMLRLDWTGREMSDSRSRFFKWAYDQQKRPQDHTEWALEIWQAAEKLTADRCARLAIANSHWLRGAIAANRIHDEIRAEFGGG